MAGDSKQESEEERENWLQLSQFRSDVRRGKRAQTVREPGERVCESERAAEKRARRDVWLYIKVRRRRRRHGRQRQPHVLQVI